MVQVLLGVSQLVYLAAMATLGARLLARSLRTREAPGALLAVHFLLCCTLAYALLAGGLVLARDAGRAAPGTVRALLGSGQLASAIGVLAGAGFNWRVFRPEARWAAALVLALSLAMATGLVGSAVDGGFSGRPDDRWYWVLYATAAAAAVWVAIEPLRYWVAARRRLRLGLADPVIVDRFLLWGAGSLCRFGMLAVGAVGTAAGVGLDGSWRAPALLIATALLGVGVAVAYWLAFFPPISYLRRVRAAHALA